ncbi:MAG: ABC transporter permease [Lachnospiraceae bacterium]|nr:ABC transporter permease [Lachnospiraceae bacterium]
MMILKLNMKRNLNGIFRLILFLLPIIAIILFNIIIFSDDKEQTDNSFVSKCRVGIWDQDKTEFSNEMIRYLSERYSIKILDGSEIQHELIKNKIDYAVILPMGLYESIRNNDSIEITSVSLTESSIYIFVDYDINSYLHQYVIASDLTDTDTELQSFVKDINENAVKVNLIIPQDNQEERGISSAIKVFWGFIIFFMIYYNCYFGMKLYQDKRNGILTRITTTKYSYGKYVISLLLSELGIYIIQLLVILVFMLLAVKSLNAGMVIDIILVLLGSGLTGFMLGTFMSSISKTKNMFLALLNILINVLAMLGGLYWSILYMPENMLVLSKLTPTYWLKIAMDNVLNGESLLISNEIWMISIFIIILFVMAVAGNRLTAKEK